MSKEHLEQIKGVVKTITFHNEENGYTVARIEPEDGRKGSVLTVTGHVKMLAEGETVVLNGYWVDDQKYGRQFRFHSYESVTPSTLEGIKRFLASRFIKGVGPVLAGRIVDAFGKDTIRILDEEPWRLGEVPGLNPKKCEEVISGWGRHRHIRDVMVFLQSYDISSAYAARIYEQYGDETVDVMRDNPYRLIRDIRGIGFIKADQVAAKLGIAKDSPHRIRAGLLYTMDDCTDKGHIYVPLLTIVENAAETMEVDAGPVTEALDHLKRHKEFIIEEDRVYRSELYQAEFEIARRLRSIIRTPRPGGTPQEDEARRMLQEIEADRKIEFATHQREAIVQAVRSKLLVLTGGPGTGKTTTVLGIIDLFRRLRLSVLLCAPTGRAAKRLTETTGMEAKTIHRMLEFNPHTGKFTKNEGDHLGAHVIIVDEASMIDTPLMTDFLRAVSPFSTLVIVGDVDQLPSIGPGSVLRDIIDSGAVPTVRLTEIFRQAASSRIVLSAHRINTGKMPFTDNAREGNFFFLRAPEPAKIAETIVDMVSRRLPQSYGFDPVNDIQVLSPMHKGETGVMNLNSLLQEKLNPFDPSLPEVRYGHRLFRQGDKVMQVRNNYDKMVFNGDIGRIERIDPERSLVRVKFDDTVEYSLNELDDLVPAYAISVHKSQGSEFRCVVAPVSTQHYIMLKRNLLYTAVTRARELVVLAGDMKALGIAISNDQVRERFTSLAERLNLEMLAEETKSP
ncbi:MAG: SF1B family DNA helicase RecD2 [Candidatus Latescibacterota bacterium]